MEDDKKQEMDRVVKIFDWVILGAAVLCSVFLGMGIGKVSRNQSKQSIVYGIALMMFLLGVGLRNVLKNQSWK